MDAALPLQFKNETFGPRFLIILPPASGHTTHYTTTLYPKKMPFFR